MSGGRIELTGVSKMFGEVRALNEINLSIGPGVTGLLGPNGSGKSTLIKLMAGLLTPDTGSIRVLGEDPLSSVNIRRELGLCPEQDRFYEDMGGDDFVYALTRLNGYEASEARRLSSDAIKRVGMAKHCHKPMGEMSRGMRQRIKLAQAIAHQPKVILLDEPLTGTDPVGRAELIAVIRELGEKGACVIVSSHVLHEVEAMTQDVVFIRFGRLRARGHVFSLRALIKDRPYRLRIKVEENRTLGSLLIQDPLVNSVVLMEDGYLEITTLNLAEASRVIRSAVDSLGQNIEALYTPDADLESVYQYLIGDGGS